MAEERSAIDPPAYCFADDGIFRLNSFSRCSFLQVILSNSTHDLPVSPLRPRHMCGVSLGDNVKRGADEITHHLEFLRWVGYEVCRRLVVILRKRG
jgi:hypothetical protein